MPPDPLTSSMLKPNFGKFCVTPLAILPLNVHVQSCTCKMEQLSSAQRTASTCGNDSRCFTTAMNGQRSHDPHMNESRTTCTSTGVWAHHKHVCKHTHTCAPMHSAHPQAYHKHVCKHTHMRTYALCTSTGIPQAHVQTYTHMRTYALCTSTGIPQARVQMYTHMCTYALCTSTGIHKHVCKCIHMCTPTCTCIIHSTGAWAQARVQRYTHVHTYAHRTCQN